MKAKIVCGALRVEVPKDDCEEVLLFVKYQNGSARRQQLKGFSFRRSLVLCPPPILFLQIRRANAHPGPDPGRDLRKREGGSKRREGGGRPLQGREAVCPVAGTE